MLARSNDIKQAVDLLKAGKLIAYPTEAVYGLGCDPFSVDAISELLALKHRAMSNGFILVAADWDQVETLALPIEPRLLAQVFDTWPGPHTWLFPASDAVPKWIRGDHKTVAIRISAHPTVTALCRAFGGPIVSTSANIEKQPPTRDYLTTSMSFKNKVGLVLNGRVGQQLHPSDIRDAITGELVRSSR